MSNLSIPPSSATVSVAIINTTSWAYNVPCADLFRPRFHGLDTFDLCSYSFLITHRSLVNGEEKVRNVLFDLGIRKDWENLVPSMVKKLKQWGTRLEIEAELSDILQEGGVNLADIEAIVWSHLHWDHTGNPAKFPHSVKLLVGPGIKERQMPGWPQIPTAEFNEVDIAGRDVVEISSDRFTIDVGGLKGYDYFGDGSFYLINAPGHSLGHLNALARTTADPESFILMAADSVHLGGEFRPTEALPLPQSVNERGLIPCPCSQEILMEMHPRGSTKLPYLGLDPRFPEDLVHAEKVIERIQEFDADPRVLVIFSHDTTIFNILEYFPKTANGWKGQGWKEAGRWRFLVDLQKIARAHEDKKQGARHE